MSFVGHTAATQLTAARVLWSKDLDCLLWLHDQRRILLHWCLVAPDHRDGERTEGQNHSPLDIETMGTRLGDWVMYPGEAQHKCGEEGGKQGQLLVFVSGSSAPFDIT